MRQSDRSDVRAEVDRVAQEYRGRGYQVILSPSASDLPEFARDLQPDIVARRQDDSLLIEVKRGSSVRDNERLRAIAQRVEAQPGWRFVLVSSAHEPAILMMMSASSRSHLSRPRKCWPRPFGCEKTDITERRFFWHG